LSAVDTETVEIGLTDANSSCLLRSPGTTSSRYVVMPMRL
jgi:DNA polymerase III sliding clamp (beta) subunit (PCNA family)